MGTAFRLIIGIVLTLALSPGAAWAIDPTTARREGLYSVFRTWMMNGGEGGPSPDSSLNWLIDDFKRYRYSLPRYSVERQSIDRMENDDWHYLGSRLMNDASASAPSRGHMAIVMLRFEHNGRGPHFNISSEWGNLARRILTDGSGTVTRGQVRSLLGSIYHGITTAMNYPSRHQMEAASFAVRLMLSPALDGTRTAEDMSLLREHASILERVARHEFSNRDGFLLWNSAVAPPWLEDLKALRAWASRVTPEERRVLHDIMTPLRSTRVHNYPTRMLALELDVASGAMSQEEIRKAVEAEIESIHREYRSEPRVQSRMMDKLARVVGPAAPALTLEVQHILSDAIVHEVLRGSLAKGLEGIRILSEHYTHETGVITLLLNRLERSQNMRVVRQFHQSGSPAYVHALLDGIANTFQHYERWRGGKMPNTQLQRIAAVLKRISNRRNTTEGARAFEVLMLLRHAGKRGYNSHVLRVFDITTGELNAVVATLLSNPSEAVGATYTRAIAELLNDPYGSSDPAIVALREKITAERNRIMALGHTRATENGHKAGTSRSPYRVDGRGTADLTTEEQKQIQWLESALAQRAAPTTATVPEAEDIPPPRSSVKARVGTNADAAGDLALEVPAGADCDTAGVVRSVMGDISVDRR